jgi:hypothetical protein
MVLKGVMLCSNKDVNNIIRLYKQGESIKKLENQFPISGRTIKRILNFKGIKIRDIKEASLKGKQHPRWKGKITDKRGYVRIHCPGHPRAIKVGGSYYIAEHRLVMEKHLGRYLNKGEVVHHIDGNPSNNKLCNLKIFNTFAHLSYHGKKRKMIRDSNGRFLNSYNE